MLRIGTSGFSYKDWVGPYYPQGLPKKDWLSFHSREFSTCEINYTYYRVPNPYTLAAMARKVPDDFLFTLKANKGMTHERQENEEVFRQFAEALSPWLERSKLGCILAQFPSSFRVSADNRDYLKLLRERLADLPVVVEFRHASWVSPATFELLRELNLTSKSSGNGSPESGKWTERLRSPSSLPTTTGEDRPWIRPASSACC